MPAAAVLPPKFIVGIELIVNVDDPADEAVSEDGRKEEAID